jgi:hypothetical protein
MTTPKVAQTVRWKSEAADLIAELHRNVGITSPALLAELLAISERYALAILTDQGLRQPRPKMTAAEVLKAIDKPLARRVRLFRRVHQFRFGTSRAATID